MSKHHEGHHDQFDITGLLINIVLSIILILAVTITILIILMRIKNWLGLGAQRKKYGEDSVIVGMFHPNW
jgi:uncharacterized protein YybS (DUF2232 family)